MCRVVSPTWKAQGTSCSKAQLLPDWSRESAGHR